MHGGAADRSGLIHVGDEVIEVNNINVEGKTPGDVLQILVSSTNQWHWKLHLYLIGINYSKTLMVLLLLNWCHRMVKWVNVKVKCV